MKKYIYYDSKGCITNWVSFPSGMDPSEFKQKFEEGFIECPEDFEVHTYSNYYVELGQLIAKPLKPFEDAKFDYKNKQWYDPRSLDEAKTKKWYEIKIQRSEKYKEPFLFEGNLFQPNVEAITAKAQIAQLDMEGFTQTWLTVDNNPVELDGISMVNMSLALDTKHSEIFTKSQQLRTSIESSTTNEEVDAIHWNSL